MLDHSIRPSNCWRNSSHKEGIRLKNPAMEQLSCNTLYWTGMNKGTILAKYSIQAKRRTSSLALQNWVCVSLEVVRKAWICPYSRALTC